MSDPAVDSTPVLDSRYLSANPQDWMAADRDQIATLTEALAALRTQLDEAVRLLAMHHERAMRATFRHHPEDRCSTCTFLAALNKEGQ